MRGSLFAVAALCSAVSTAAFASPAGLEIAALKAEWKQNAEGESWVEVTGAIRGAPDGTTVTAELHFPDLPGLVNYAQVAGERFRISFGPSEKKLLPGTYQVRVAVDPRVQKLAVAKALGAEASASAATALQVGTPAEARNEKQKIRKKYEDLLEGLYALYLGLAQWGSSIATQSVLVKLNHRGRVPKRAAARVLREWEKFTRVFERDLPTLRFDHKQFSEYFLLGYFPGPDGDVAQIITTLERWHASLTAVIYKNLGLELPKELEEKSGFNPGELKEKLVPLAARVYEDLGLEPLSWALAESGIPESSKDINGDWFRSTVSKFTVKKPGPKWFFDVGATNPAMRIRMRYRGEQLTKKIVMGVELRDYTMAESMADLARLEERSTRSRYPGFELISIKRISPPDPTMPKKKRPGQEMRFTIKAGETTFFVLQYSLFCRWHKRTYNMMSFAEDSVKNDWIPVFEKTNKTFRVLDHPKFKKERELQEELMRSDEAGDGDHGKTGKPKDKR
ncbi:MAG: hypothetical protein D6731_22810 [Planctomycetota bacterium]|nr:MAG: hypothetical protein D6731_22810 [Planctomycetota bacterium]